MKNVAMALSVVPALLLASCDTATSEKAENPTVDKQKSEVNVEPMEPAESIDAGINIGDDVPNAVTLKTSGGELSLADALDGKPAVLIFTRSVEWCPYCQTQLKAANTLVDGLKDRGYQLFGVSYDSVDKQDRFIMNQMLDYKMLSDEPSTLIDAFELRDPQYTEGRAMGVPYASVIVVDKDGKVAAKSVSGDYKKRPTNDQILTLLDNI